MIFDGIPKIDHDPDHWYYKDRTQECPKCKGHGKWRVHASDLGCQICNICDGWGWIKEGDWCDHETRELSYETCKSRDIPHHGMCWHVYECTKCGMIRAYDSSD